MLCRATCKEHNDILCSKHWQGRRGCWRRVNCKTRNVCCERREETHAELWEKISVKGLCALESLRISDSWHKDPCHVPSSSAPALASPREGGQSIIIHCCSFPDFVGTASVALFP